MDRRKPVVVAALCCLIASGGSDARHPSDAVLIEASLSQAALRAAVIESQRELLRAVAEDDSMSLDQLLSPLFIVYDVRDMISASESSNATARSRQIGYFEVLAGALQDHIDSTSFMYHAAYGDDRATVIAVGVEDAVRATWERRAHGWVATRVILITVDEAMRLVERST